MDASYLFQTFTTPPSCWTQGDISIWLELLNMKEYQNQFELNKIDGLIIFDIEDQEMQDLLGISNSIHRKRLRNGIKILKQFQEQFEQRMNALTQPRCDFNDDTTSFSTSIINSQPVEKAFSIKNKKMVQLNSQTAPRRELENIFNDHHALLNFDHHNTHFIEEDGEEKRENKEDSKSKLKRKARRKEKIAAGVYSNKENLSSQNSSHSMNLEELGGQKLMTSSRHTRKSPIFFENDGNYFSDSPIEELLDYDEDQAAQEIGIRSTAELIVQPIDGVQTNNFYCINEKGGKIGRHSNNEIVILEESVSRYHAVIEFTENKFFLTDIGSTTGSFIKIVNPLILQEDMIIEMGSNQFYVERITIFEDKDGEENGEVKLKVIEGLYADREFLVKNAATIGRKGRFSSTTIALNDDLHFSNTHAKISLINSQFVLEDLGSTNGSWLRMSPEGTRSEPIELADQAIFKIGASYTFKVKRSNTNYLEMMQDSRGNEEEGSNCAICYENDRDVVFIPCKHNVSCIKCCKNLKVCPVCRVKITDIMKIYRS